MSAHQSGVGVPGSSSILGTSPSVNRITELMAQHNIGGSVSSSSSSNCSPVLAALSVSVAGVRPAGREEAGMLIGERGERDGLSCVSSSAGYHLNPLLLPPPLSL